MENPIVFYGCEAFLCKVKGKTLCDVWLQDPRNFNPAFDPSLAVEIDLSKNPFENPTDVELDNHRSAPTDLGLTDFGPTFPLSRKGTSGEVWVTHNVLQRVAAGGYQVPPTEGYRWQVLRYVDSDGTIRRYLGFHAEMVDDQVNPPLFQIWNSMDDATKPSSVTLPVDMAKDADSSTSEVPSIGKQGKLFLSWAFVKSTNGALLSPKLPIGQGGRRLP